MKQKIEYFKWFLSRVIILFSILFIFIACIPSSPTTYTPVPETSSSRVANFDHIVVVTFENREYHNVIGNLFMPTYNGYAGKYALLTQYYAVTHPSLPNYIAMIGGDTFEIDRNCKDCFIHAMSLPDLIEASGRTWKTYQEDMQTPCALGSQDENEYVQKHNPFVYFDAIRLDKQRCTSMVVSMKELYADIEAGSLPNSVNHRLR
jgi:acid phosphatase